MPNLYESLILKNTPTDVRLEEGKKSNLQVQKSKLKFKRKAKKQLKLTKDVPFWSGREAIQSNLADKYSSKADAVRVQLANNPGDQRLQSRLDKYEKFAQYHKDQSKMFEKTPVRMRTKLRKLDKELKTQKKIIRAGGSVPILTQVGTRVKRKLTKLAVDPEKPFRRFNKRLNAPQEEKPVQTGDTPRRFKAAVFGRLDPKTGAPLEAPNTQGTEGSPQDVQAYTDKLLKPRSTVGERARRVLRVVSLGALGKKKKIKPSASEPERRGGVQEERMTSQERRSYLKQLIKKGPWPSMKHIPKALMVAPIPGTTVPAIPYAMYKKHKELKSAAKADAATDRRIMQTAKFGGLALGALVLHDITQNRRQRKRKKEQGDDEEE